MDPGESFPPLRSRRLISAKPTRFCILLDILMPVMDGWDFRAAQLADPGLREIPVIVMSASGFGRDTIRTQLKTFDVVPKPLELDAFLKTVRQACGLEDDEPSSSTG
jgi:CheY-like chemotaxis protein